MIRKGIEIAVFWSEENFGLGNVRLWQTDEWGWVLTKPKRERCGEFSADGDYVESVATGEHYRVTHGNHQHISDRTSREAIKEETNPAVGSHEGSIAAYEITADPQSLEDAK